MNQVKAAMLILKASIAVIVCVFIAHFNGFSASELGYSLGTTLRVLTVPMFLTTLVILFLLIKDRNEDE